MKKNVPVLASFAFGLKETFKHWPRLLPLTFVFYLPELLDLVGFPAFASHVIIKNLYQVIVFFYLISLSLKVTARKELHQDKGGSAKNFLIAKAIKWSAMAVAILLGLVPAWWWYHRQTGLFPLDFSGLKPLWESGKLSVEWMRARPWHEQGVLGLVCLLPPYLVFVDWNFFGYAIVEKDISPWESLKQAKETARGAFWGLTLFYIGCAFWILVGLELWTVGIVFTFPVTLLATVYVYRELSKQTKLK